jgi:hypothetical protein
MKNSRKVLSVLGLLGAPVALSLLSVAAPTAGLIAVFFLGLGMAAIGPAFILILIIALAGSLVRGQQDPIRPIVFGIL